MNLIFPFQIVTFENSYIKTSKDSNKNISENEWSELLVKETLRLKKKPAKRKAGDLFGSESTELTTDNFLSLDLAKKNRRIEQLLSKKADLKEELEEKILETIPEPRTLKVSVKISLIQLLRYIHCEFTAILQFTLQLLVLRVSIRINTLFDFNYDSS